MNWLLSLLLRCLTMDKQQGYHLFFSSFGIPAYEENSVPDDAEFPYITYEKYSGQFGYPVYPAASIWTRSDSWANADYYLERIEMFLGNGGVLIPIDNGCKIFINKSDPFAQGMGDEADRLIKRYILNFQVEFFSFY